MEMTAKKQQERGANVTVYRILFAIGIGHLINDSLQSVIPALFPILEKSMNLNYTQIGWISFALNMVSSVMQPVFGVFSDRRPTPFLLPLSMCLTFIGIIVLAVAPTFLVIILGALLVGLGSAIFHPEGSKVAYLAAGRKRGLAQSIYQVGGNTGQAMAPVFTAFIFVAIGQFGAIWFTIVAVIGFVVLFGISKWYKEELLIRKQTQKRMISDAPLNKKVIMAIYLLIFLVFARSWYIAGILNFFQFYVMDTFDLSIRSSQMYVFLFMLAGALGTFFGGPLADRIGKKNILFLSMVSSLPFTLMLPHVTMAVSIPLLFLSGFIIQLGFSVTVVYAQELVPGKIGLVSGLMTGLAFGLGAIGAVLFGKLADMYSLYFIMVFCSLLPILGLFAWFLPSDQKVWEMHHKQ